MTGNAVGFVAMADGDPSDTQRNALALLRSMGITDPTIRSQLATWRPSIVSGPSRSEHSDLPHGGRLHSPDSTARLGHIRTCGFARRICRLVLVPDRA